MVLRERFLPRSNAIAYDRSLAGFGEFEKIVIKAGIVKALFAIGNRPGNTKDTAVRAWNAAEALWKLMMLGSPTEKPKLLEKYLECGVIDFCLKVSLAYLLHSTVVDWCKLGCSADREGGTINFATTCGDGRSQDSRF